MQQAIIQTHESYINQIRELALSFIDKDNQPLIDKLTHVKLCYGGTERNVRGTTIYNEWDNSLGIVETVIINPRCETSFTQIAGTCLHELGHVISGHQSGHNPDWKASCIILGLQNVKALGQEYNQESFNPAFWEMLSRIPEPTDGKPVKNESNGLFGSAVPCSHGHGSRGGKSRGKGSGSRLIKYTCQCDKPIIIRHAGHELDVTCNICSTKFIESEVVK